MFGDIEKFGVSIVFFVIIMTTFLIPLFRKILKSFDSVLTQKELLFKLNTNVEQLLGNLSGSNNCNKTQLISLVNLYFSNVSLKLHRMILNMKNNTELLKDKILLRQMISNNFEKILQDSNIYITDFKYNAKNVDLIIVSLIDKIQIQQSIQNIIENQSINSVDVQCLIDNLFIAINNQLKN